MNGAAQPLIAIVLDYCQSQANMSTSVSSIHILIVLFAVIWLNESLDSAIQL